MDHASRKVMTPGRGRGAILGGFVLVGSFLIGGAGVGPGEEVRLCGGALLGHLVVPARPESETAAAPAARWAAVKARSAAVLAAMDGPEVETLRRVLRCRLTLSWLGEEVTPGVPDLLLTLDFQHDLRAVGRLLEWFEDVTILDGRFSQHQLSGWPVTRFRARKPAPFEVWYSFRGSLLIATSRPETLARAILRWKRGPRRTAGSRASGLGRQPGTDFAMVLEPAVLQTSLKRGPIAGVVRLLKIESPGALTVHVKHTNRGLFEELRLEDVTDQGLLADLGLDEPTTEEVRVGSGRAETSREANGVEAPPASEVLRRTLRRHGWWLQAHIEPAAAARLAAVLDLGLAPLSAFRRRAAASTLLRRAGLEADELIAELHGEIEVVLVPGSGSRWRALVRSRAREAARLQAMLERLATSAGGTVSLERGDAVWSGARRDLVLPGLPLRRWFWRWDGSWLLCAEGEEAIELATLASERPSRRRRRGVQVDASLSTWLGTLLPPRVRADWPVTEAATERPTRLRLGGDGGALQLANEGPDGLVTPLLAGHALAWLEDVVAGEDR